MELFCWGALPYISFALLIGGLIWRYRTDQYGWTSRSSQIYEGRLLRWSSPMFHFGILAVAMGHVMGLVVPASWTKAMGVSQHVYHLLATFGGALAGLVTLLGLAGLLYRRFVNHSVRLATSANDLWMYFFLLVAIILGASATVINQIMGVSGGYNYRETISVWFRSIFMLQPNIELMHLVPLSFKLHIISGLILFAVWPFTRLVHVLSVPIAYPSRPFIVYRYRQAATRTAETARGWEPVGRSKKSGFGKLNNGSLAMQSGKADPEGA